VRPPIGVRETEEETMTPRAFWALLLVAPACDDKGDDTAGEADADTDADTDTDTDTDTDADTDCAGTVAGTAAVKIVGEGAVDPWKTYTGTESREYRGVDGPLKQLVGDPPFCKINYALTSTAVRKDCIGDHVLDCTDGWAFDLVTATAAIDATYSNCEPILCGDAVSTFDGVAIAYAYGIYLGHPELLGTWSKAKSGWAPAGYPSYDEKTGALTYDYAADPVSYYE
jgi:hypothetical protein